MMMLIVPQKAASIKIETMISRRKCGVEVPIFSKDKIL